MQPGKFWNKPRKIIDVSFSYYTREIVLKAGDPCCWKLEDGRSTYLIHHHSTTHQVKEGMDGKQI